MPKMTKLRKEARDRPCMVRVPDICTYGGEDTVLAHYRMAGLSGMGQKPDDRFGAWACHACHDAIDGRGVSVYKGIDARGLTRDDLRLLHAEGVFRTQQQLISEGKL